MTWKETTSLCVTSSFKTYSEGKDMRYRRWSRITTDRFSNSERRKRKVLGRSGGILPLWNFSDFNFLNTLFLGFWVIQTGYWPVADESLQIGGLLHQGQFPYCSGYEARRVQTIFYISTWKFLYYKIKLIMKYRTDFRKSVHVETGVDPCLRYYRNYIISSTFCFGKKKTIDCGK